MKDFDSLKNMWQQQGPANDAKPLPPVTAGNHSVTLKMKLQKQQLVGAVMLIITAILIMSMAIFGNFNFIHWYTYGSMVLVCIICLLQSVILAGTYKKIKSIDETAIPAIHLQQWEAYYAFRKKQIQWNMPVYFILLNLAMAIYFLEVLGGRPLINVLVFLAIYIAWMLFSYFYLGRKKLKKENTRLQNIIDELKEIVKQLNAAE